MNTAFVSEKLGKFLGVRLTHGCVEYRKLYGSDCAVTFSVMNVQLAFSVLFENSLVKSHNNVHCTVYMSHGQALLCIKS